MVSREPVQLTYRKHGTPSAYSGGCRCDDCRIAHNSKNLEYKKNNSERTKQQQNDFAKKQREQVKQVLDVLKGLPCTDCGNRFPPECMDFDHIENNKFKGVAQLAKVYNLAKVIDEVAKCELVCANCHRIRTRKRREDA